MEPPPCNFSICNNANANANQLYRHKARTFQPQMHLGRGLSDWDSTSIPREKTFIMKKYFTSTMPHQAESAKYANLPSSMQMDESQEHLFYHQHHHPLQHPARPAPHHQHVHTRSQSHSHYYHTMGHCHGNDYYYNLPHKQTAIEANNLTRSPQQMLEPPLMSPPIHHTHGKLDPLMVMQVCNEISDTPIDSSPPIPKSRDYTVAALRDGNLYRFGFPQKRYITSSFTDPVKKITLPRNHPVTVLGPSQSDRSKFTVCCSGCCDNIQLRIDIPHQLTKMALH